MTDSTPRSRWTLPGILPDDLDNEQRQRVHALRAAREVLEGTTRTGPFTGASQPAVEPDALIQIAVYVVDGAGGVLAIEASRDEQLLRYRASEKAIGVAS